MKTKSAAAALFLLALGFGGGWFGRGMLQFAADGGPRIAGPRKDLIGTSASAPDRKSADVAPKQDAPDAAAVQRRAAVDRLGALSWGTQHGLPIGVNVFQNDGLDPTFVTVYDLSPGEVATIDEAIHAAKDKLYAVALQNARVQPSADGTRLVVEVPSTTDQGSAIYDGLLQTFSGVLGPDRLQAFNQLSGNSFENGFGSFGLTNTRYEMAPSEQTTAAGDPIYKIVVSSTLPDVQTSSTSTLPIEQVGTYYPVLSHFASTQFQAHHGPN